MVDAAEGTAKSGRGRTGAARRRSPPAAGPVRGRIPALQPAQAEALREFFSTSQSWFLADNGLLRFMPGSPGARRETFELDAEGARLGLRLQVAEVLDGDGLHWSDYRGRSRILAWALAHEAHLMRLSEALGVVFTPLVDPEDAKDPQDPAVWLDFVIDDDDPDASPEAARRPPATQGTLRLPAGWLARVLARAEPPFEDEPPPPLGRWRELPARVCLQLPIAPLDHEEWAGLRPGDVLVAGRRSHLPGFEAHAGGRLWPLALTEQGWQVQGPPQHLPRPAQDRPSPDRPQQETAMTDNDSPDSPAEDAADAPAKAPADPDAVVRQLPVRVAFELARLEMPLGELSALQPGYVFALPAQLEGANVTIRANGEAVGQGEMVAVGDTLGVRLLSWK